MAGKSSQSNNRGTDLFGMFVSGKGKDFHTYKNAKHLAPQTGMSASGGTITNYTDGPISYRAHTFTSSGTFVVNTLSQNISGGDDIEYLVVAGGGSGGQNLAGGGGAGGLRTNLSGHPLAAPTYTVSSQSYTVTIGGGGAAVSTNNGTGNNGVNSEFYPTPVSYPSTARIRAVGGGGGSGGGSGEGQDGGSGGGSPGYGYSQPGNSPAYNGGAGNVPQDPNHSQVQGYPGGQNGPNYGNNYIGGGGGGAGAVGYPGDRPGGSVSDSATSGNGGPGSQVNIIPSPPSINSGNGYHWAGGGGAGAYTNSGPERHAGDGGLGGGGGGASNDASTPGVGGGSALNSGGNGTPGPTTGPSSGGAGGANTGGGGGSCGHNNGPVSGAGGSGIVIVRYKMSTY